MLISVLKSQVAKKKMIQFEYAKERVGKWECLSPTTSYSREGHRELYNLSEKVFKLSMTGLKNSVLGLPEKSRKGLMLHLIRGRELGQVYIGIVTRTCTSY